VLWSYYSDAFSGKWDGINKLEFVFANVAFVMIMILFVIMCIFLQFHKELIDKNSSTLENLEEKKSGPPTTSFDMGWEFNWCQVMGKNKWLWPIPYIGDKGKPNGDGVVFPKKEGGNVNSQYEMNEYGDTDDDKKELNQEENQFENPLTDYAKTYNQSMAPGQKVQTNQQEGKQQQLSQNYSRPQLNSNSGGNNPLTANTHFQNSYSNNQNQNSSQGNAYGGNTAVNHNQ